ncbi:MAG TPA: helicase SNF2, partial [Phaeodactylibacter sp.]|nr:helicase SNF2 [Phaeodactylibacter sp.]
MRKTYGNTWWGKQWLNSLNNIDYSNRLPRGRTYANKGLARNIEINKNVITAEVQGSRRKPYDVFFSIPKFSATEKAKIIGLITDNPFFLSKLLNRELPPNLNRLCEENEIHIFPHDWGDLEGNCSCPDWAIPCKHMASVLYLVANEIDKNPFLVFQLHDFDLFKGLEGVGYSANEQTGVSIFSIDDLHRPFSFEKDKKEWDEALYQTLDFSIIPDCRDSLLTILSEQPVFYNAGKFKMILEKVYAKVAREVSKNTFSKNKKTTSPPDEALAKTMDEVEEIEILLDAELDYTTTTLRNIKGKSILNFDKEEEFIHWLEQLPIEKLTQFSPALRGLFLTFLFSKKIIQQSAYHAQLLRVGAKRFKVRWIAANLNEEVKNAFDKVHTLTPDDLIFYKKGSDILEPVPQDRFMALVSFFLNHFVHTYHNLNYNLTNHSAVNLFFNGSVERFVDFENKEYPGAIQLWLNRFFISEKEFVPVLMVDDQEEEGMFQVKIAVEDKSKPLQAPIELDHLLEDNKFSSVRLE